jgi:hypothetical protein
MQYPHYHFLLIAPNLSADWLFDAALSYWDRFRPTVVSDLRLVGLIPAELQIIVTVIAARDTMAHIGVEMAQYASHAVFDPLPADSFDVVKAELERRATNNQPFAIFTNGAAIPTNTPDPNVFIPTPRLPTRPPSGFITQTPVPAFTPEATATPVLTVVIPAGSETPPPTTQNPDEPTPLQRTPGPITGG